MSFPKSSGQVQLMTEKQIIKQPCNNASPPLTQTIAMSLAYEQKVIENQNINVEIELANASISAAFPLIHKK